MEKPIQTIFNPSKKSHNSQALNLRINENQGDDDPWFNYIPPDLSDSSKTKRNSKLLKQILKSANEKENIPHHHNLNYTNPEAQKSRNSNESKTFEVDFEEFPEKKINDTSPNIFFEISPQTMIINNEIPKNTQKIIDLSNNINMNINKATHSIEKKIKSKNQSKILDTQFISPNELTECTFTPITRSKSQEKRSLKEFLDSQTKFQKQQEAKIKNVLFIYYFIIEIIVIL